MDITVLHPYTYQMTPEPTVCCPWKRRPNFTLCIQHSGSIQASEIMGPWVHTGLSLAPPTLCCVHFKDYNLVVPPT